jgi:hypothetical protein
MRWPLSAYPINTLLNTTKRVPGGLFQEPPGTIETTCSTELRLRPGFFAPSYTALLISASGRSGACVFGGTCHLLSFEIAKDLQVADLRSLSLTS